MSKPKRDASHVRLYRCVLESEAYRSLPDSARSLYVDLRANLTGNNNGWLTCTLSVLHRWGWNSNDKLLRALQNLLDRGLLVRTKKCPPNVRHEASRYAFTDIPICAHPAHGIAGKQETHAYREWKYEKPEISDIRQTVKNGTASRTATAPSHGEHPPKTVPSHGEQEFRDKPMSEHAKLAIVSKSRRLPSHGEEVLSITRAPVNAEPPGESIPTVGDRLTTEAEYLAALRSAPDERERSRLKYEWRTRRASRQAATR